MANVNRPFVPGSGTTTTSNSSTTAPSTINNAPISRWATADDNVAVITPDPGQTEDSGKYTQGLSTVGEATNEALMQLLNSDDYLPNKLSEYRQPMYRFRLFMTTEHELLTSAGTGDLSSLYKALDAIPQITIAQSGVTAGFNITNVELDQAVGPGFRNRSSYMTGINIDIVEPLGSSMTEAIMNASIELGIQNFAKMWYFLELSFIAYNEDGSINQSPLEEMGLANGGRWIYQISITDMNVTMDEGGASYKLTCVPYSMLAFDDDTAGRVPDLIRVGGGTIKEFCDNFAEQLTKKWTDRYLGEIYKFKIEFKPISDGPDPTNFKLVQSEIDPVRNISLSQTGRVPEAQIPRGATINDVITFLFCNCEETQQLMLDTNSPYELKDSGGDGGETATFNGKQYRVPIVPMVEPEIKITGYDPITGHYMKEITYYVWGYRSYTSNLCVEQFSNIQKDPRVAVKIAQELKQRNYLKKRYEYLYTGLNTEVIRFDLTYNFAFCAVLPKISGWRQGIKQVSVHEKYNPALKNNADMKDQNNDISVGEKKSLQEVQTALASSQSRIDDAQRIVDDPMATDEAKRAAQADLDAAAKDRARLQQSAQIIRSEALARQKTTRETIEREGVVNIFAEDALSNNQSSYNMTYVQAHDEGANAAGGAFLGQWHRGASLTGSLLNQMYAPVTSALASISLEIKGDPYWISYSNLERRSIVTGSQKSDPNGVLPNYTDGDSTFALIFKFPSRIGDSGEPVIRDDDVFNGLYRVVNVKSRFSNGAFTQTLDAVKLELISTAITANNNTPSSGGAAAGT
jgi:hypothetical protein